MAACSVCIHPRNTGSEWVGVMVIFAPATRTVRAFGALAFRAFGRRPDGYRKELIPVCAK